ncbi:unnamed protein product [Ectocarpus sp. CCAP 1310/34]|nr:unnamed protein product [Ectocarpus sp. CCAP 1310/34]
MVSSGPLAGVISPELCWSAHGNELRVHSTARLEPHAGHKTTGLPVQALFRFLSEPERERERGPVRGTVLLPQNKRAKPLQPQNLALGSGAMGQSVCVTDSTSVITSTTGAATRIASKPGTTGSPKDAADISPQPGNGQLVSAGSPPVGGGSRRGSPTFSRVGSGSFPRKRGGASRNAAGKLSVRAVEAFELRDGRTVLVCLASERELPSEVHCVDPFSGETLHVATGLPILLTSLAVVPRLALPSQGRHCRSRQEGGGGGGATRSSLGGDAGLSSSAAAVAAAAASGSHGAWTDAAAAAAAAGDDYWDDAEEVVVAVGGVGGRVTLLALQEQQEHGGKRGRDSSSIRRCPFRSWPAREEGFGGVPSEREGVPITSMSAFSVAVVAGDGEDLVPPGRGIVVVAMVAAGWSDGSWAVAPCCYSRHDSSCGRIDVGSSAVEGIGDAWAEACSPESGDLATGDTGGLGPALHFVCQDNTVPSTLSPAGEPCTKLRLWVTTASGFLCFEILLAGGCFSWPQALPPLVTRQRPLIPGVRPQSLRAMAVGGGRSLPVMILASFRPSDGSPVLIVLDTDAALAAATVATATAAAAAAAAAAAGFATKGESGKNPEPLWSSSTGGAVDGRGGRGGGLQDGGGGVVISGERGDEHEVELATRCCSKSVFPARPHAVFVDPAEVKAFVCRRRRRRWRCGDDCVVVVPGSSALAPPLSAPSPPDKDKLHLKFPVILAEASLDETGRPRLRAWEQSHAGLAHKVAVDAEVLGLLGYCDPSEEDLDADTAHDITAVGEASLDHVVGGPDNLWARPFFETKDGNGEHHSAAVAGAAPSPLMLLAARLQGAVALGRGPAVARSLTAVVLPRGGEWMLPRARPVQEWAAAVALEAWDEASSLTAALHAPPGASWPSAPWLDDVAVTLEALARRSRQAERILEASIERCRQYCKAANASCPEPVPVGVLRLRRRRPNSAATQRLEAARVAETAPLLSRLRRAALAARLARQVSSAAAWILVSGLGRPPAAASVRIAEPSATAGREKESSPTVAGSLPGLVRPTPVHAAAAAAAAAAVVAPTVRLLERLRERGGLPARAGVRRQDKAPRRRCSKADENFVVGSGVTAGDRTGVREFCPSGGGAGAPLAVLSEMNSFLRSVFVAAGEEGFEDVDRVLGSVVGGGAEKLGEALGSLLERGLGVVAYSVMDTAFSRGLSSRAATGGTLSIDHAREPDQEAQERAILGTAETVFDRFCEQVRLTPEVRIQARLSWLLDSGAPGKAGSSVPASSCSVCVSTAAAALLCPKASACLAADSDLLAMAGAVLATHGSSRGAAAAAAAAAAAMVAEV